MQIDQYIDATAQLEILVSEWADNGVELSECNAIRKAFRLGALAAEQAVRKMAWEPIPLPGDAKERAIKAVQSVKTKEAA